MNRAHTDQGQAQSALASEANETQLRSHHWFAIAYVILALALFVLLLLWVDHRPYTGFDLSVARALQSARNPSLDFLMKLTGLPGLSPQVIVLNVAVIVILFLFRMRWEALTLTLLGPVVGLSGNLLRYTIDRPRPAPDLVWVAQEIEQGHFGFPSGHALGFTAIFGFVAFCGWTLLRPGWRRTLLVALYVFMIALVGFSRAYVGEHWPTDVIAGFLVGSVYLTVMIEFYLWGKHRFFVPKHKGDG